MGVAIELEPLSQPEVLSDKSEVSEFTVQEVGGLAVMMCSGCPMAELCQKRIEIRAECDGYIEAAMSGTLEGSNLVANTTAEFDDLVVDYRAELMDDSVEVVLAASLRVDNSKVVAESKPGNVQTYVLPTERTVKNSNPKVLSESIESTKQVAVSDKISEIKVASQVDKPEPPVSASNIVEGLKPKIDNSVIIDRIDTLEVDSKLAVDRQEDLGAGEYDVDEQSEAADDKKAEATEDGGEIETDNKAELYECEEGEINIEFDDASDLGETVEIIRKIDKEANSEFDDEIDNKIDPELIQDIESIFESKNFGDEEGFLGEYLRDDEVGDEGKITEANPLFEELEFEFYLNQILSRDFSQILEENGENIVQAVEPVDGELLAIDDLEFAGRDSIDPETRKLGAKDYRRRAKGLARRLLAVRALVLSKIIFEY